jgi:hypothetical protein
MRQCRRRHSQEQTWIRSGDLSPLLFFSLGYNGAIMETALECPNCQHLANRLGRFCAYCGKVMPVVPAAGDSSRLTFFKVVTLLVILWGLGSGIWGLRRSMSMVPPPTPVAVVESPPLHGPPVQYAPPMQSDYAASVRSPWVYPQRDDRGISSYFRSFERGLQDSHWYWNWQSGHEGRR